MADDGSRFRPRQRTSAPARRPFEHSEFLRNMLEFGKAELAQDFKGITTNGEIIPGLYPIQRTGVSAQPLIDAATTFLSALAPHQQDECTFDVDSSVWRSWSNIHSFLMRHGACLEDLNEDQRRAALALVRESLSASGFATARDIMKLNDHLRELTGQSEAFGEWFYWLSILGVPSSTEPWGWQIDGHHLIINCFILGDQIVLTPNFMGSEPVVAESGKYVRTRVLQAEELKGFALMRALTPEQQKKATIGMVLPPDVFATAFRDNLLLENQGIRQDELSEGQQHLLLDLIATYVGRIRRGHAEIKLEEVKKHLGETRFAWIGPCDNESPFYYRIHSPVILIEFDHQPGLAIGTDEPSRDHIHSLVRTPNGNDYGKDLLRQHYQQFDHSHPQTSHRLGKPHKSHTHS
jgi:hypothetical protein